MITSTPLVLDVVLKTLEHIPAPEGLTSSQMVTVNDLIKEAELALRMAKYLVEQGVGYE